MPIRRRKYNLQGNSKSRRHIKNTHWTKCQSAKKRIATYNTTINSKPNDKNHIQYKQATEFLKLTQK